MPRKKMSLGSTSTGRAPRKTVKTETSARASSLREQLFSNDLNIAEIAYILDRSPTAVAGYLRNGTIQGYRIGRSWRVTEEALRAYATKLRGVSAWPAPGTWTTSGSSGTVTYPSVTHPINSSVTFSGNGERTSRAQDEILARLDQEPERA